MKTILCSAYAVNPYKGSEDGMGWNFVLQIARFNKVIAITRKNNRADIEDYMSKMPQDVYQNIQFLYFDYPQWVCSLKKKIGLAMLYFILWQWAIPSFVRKQQISFDIAHNLNFHNDWTASFLWKLNKPMVWGPIAHHPAIPSQYLKPFKKSYWIKDRLTWTLKQLFWNYSWSLSKTVEKSSHIFIGNKSVLEVLPQVGLKYSIMSVATDDFGMGNPSQKEGFTLISAGRLIPLKGFDLSILAFAHFLEGLEEEEKKKCRLLIVGKGPEKELFQQMAKDKGVADQVDFIDWLERSALLDLYKKAHAFLFPSHEGAGMVVAEALSFGLPVICLDNAGPGQFMDEFSGIKVPIQDYQGTVEGLGEAINNLYQQPLYLEELSKGARKRFENNFHWDRRGEALQEVYEKLTLLEPRFQLSFQNS